MAIAEGVEEVTVSAEGGLRLFPEGEDGSELTSAESFRITALRTTAARLRFWPLVFRGKARTGAFVKGRQTATASTKWPASSL